MTRREEIIAEDKARHEWCVEAWRFAGRLYERFGDLCLLIDQVEKGGEIPFAWPQQPTTEEET